MLFFSCFLFAAVSCIEGTTAKEDGGAYSTFPHAREAFGNFSVELLYHTSVFQTDNFVISPFNAWTVLAVATEGAMSSTREELCRALRIGGDNTRNRTRFTFQSMSRELNLNTATIQLARFNAFLIDKSKILEKDFRAVSRLYETFTIPANLTNAGVTAGRVNKAVSVATKDLITKMVDENDFGEPQLVIASAAYFKGQWTAAFDPTATSKRPFYDSNGVQIGEVNMMYNRYTYAAADIEDLQASVIELPYGSDGRLVLLIMLPQKGVSLQKMFTNFQKVLLDAIFAELKYDQQVHGEDVIECLIPRFEIESKLEMVGVLKRLGIFRLFNDTAVLGRLARSPTHVTKVIHKNVIEVTEEGIGAAPTLEATPYAPKFEANRPFMYFVIEKTAKTIVFEGFYQQPYLY